MVKLCSAHFGFLYHTGRMMQIVKSVNLRDINLIRIGKRQTFSFVSRHMERIIVRLRIFL